MSIDISSIKKEDCISDQFPLDRIRSRQSFQVVIKRSVLNRMKIHGRSSMNAEVCGVLVGKLFWDSSPFLYIDACIEGKYSDYRVASVTFTSKTWDYIHEELSGKYPDSKIVGWYHTHPGFGIFLSGMDMFINENFFNFPWQTAYVYDPRAEQAGFFIWQDSKMKLDTAEVIEDEPENENTTIMTLPLSDDKKQVNNISVKLPIWKNECLIENTSIALFCIFLIAVIGWVYMKCICENEECKSIPAPSTVLVSKTIIRIDSSIQDERKLNDRTIKLLKEKVSK